MSSWVKGAKVGKENVRIRLARFGRAHSPVYNIVVSPKCKARDSLPIEVVGTYNPIAIPGPLGKKENKNVKEVELDIMRAKYWMGVGATPTEKVAWLFKKAGFLHEDWPKPNKFTQVVKKPVVNDIKYAEEERIQLYRHRD
ncbi:MRPS16 [[Candida] subhashii]|uniref:MRPS16 n=1 Tax=[Candida] subhashii TaxID=561895 RepID=A0A8J5UQV2_9ASCO|nr:MRPS16 [[Candida] subhashii]KAG7665011.1 MRPS16 [[Candida] subhashii]